MSGANGTNGNGNGLTLTAGELVESSGGLRGIGTYSIPNVKGSYALAKVKRQANGALADLEETRIALCVKHAKKDGEGKPLLVENRYEFIDPAAFEAEWKTLLTEPVTLLGCRAVTIDELAGATHPDPNDPKVTIAGIEPDLLFALGPLVVDAAEPSAPVALSK